MGGGIRPLHTRQCLRYPLEQVLDVVAQLGARLDEHQIVLLGLILALLCRNLALLVQIRLVAHEDDDDVVAALGPHIINPLLGILEGLRICVEQAMSAPVVSVTRPARVQPTGDVVDNHCDARITDVRRDQAPETLLAGSIPQL